VLSAALSQAPHCISALRVCSFALLATVTVAPTSTHASSPKRPPLRACGTGQLRGAPRFSASVLLQGRFTYRETTAGKDTNTFTLEIRRRVDGTWLFTGEGAGQRWEAITDSAFRPRSAGLSMLRHGRPYGFQLRYVDDSVFAFETKYDSAHNPIKERTSAAIHGTTTDQRIDWASLMASDLAVGQSAAYTVYDPATGSSELTASASEGPTLASPDGPRATIKLDYTICKAETRESYTVFSTKESPRKMLREDMRGNIVSELVRIEP
jgi:hypothetical protein